MMYWCFDEEALDRALKDWIAHSAPGEHPEAKAIMEHAAGQVRAFLHTDEAKRHKLLSVVEINTERSFGAQARRDA